MVRACGQPASRRCRLERFHFFDAAGGIVVTLRRHCFDSLADERLDVHCAFGTIEFLGRRVQRGVARQENGAAVVERFGGDGVGADFFRGGHDFKFVVACERRGAPRE